MKYLSVCSGIEAASVAWHELGWTPLAFSEIEPFPSAVLAHRFPNVPNLGDMTKYQEWQIERPNLLVGGTPCQAFSVAGLRKGLSDARGNLSLVFCQMADHFDPEWVLWENVPGVLSSQDNAFGCFLAGLCGSDEPLVAERGWESQGLVSGPKRTVAWRIQDAQYHGVAQRRRRIFVLAVRGAGNWASAKALFPIGEGLYWDSPKSRQQGKGTPAGTKAGSGVSHWDGGPHPSLMRGGMGGMGYSNQELFSQGGAGLVKAFDTYNQTVGDVAQTLKSPAGGVNESIGTVLVNAFGFEPRTPDGYARVTGDIAPTLNTMAGGQRQPAVVADWPAEVAATLNASFGDKQGLEDQHALNGGSWFVPGTVGTLTAKVPEANGAPEVDAGHYIPVAIRTANTSSNGHGFTDELAYTLDRTQGQAVAFHPTQDPISSEDVSHAMGTGSKGGAASVAVVAYPISSMAAMNRHGNDRIGIGIGNAGDPVHTLTKAHSHAVATTMQVRRLTPRECERLQGFPDDWTLIPWKNKPAEDCPDGPRYKAIGNSMAVPVMLFLGQRIQLVENGL